MLCPAKKTPIPAHPTVNDMCGKLLQVFYQGIDKVSKVVDNTCSPEEDPPDESERESKAEGVEGAVGEGGGDGTTEPAEDPLPKEDDEPEENGEGESHELTDEELAARCPQLLVSCSIYGLNSYRARNPKIPGTLLLLCFCGSQTRRNNAWFFTEIVIWQMNYCRSILSGQFSITSVACFPRERMRAVSLATTAIMFCSCLLISLLPGIGVSYWLMQSRRRCSTTFGEDSLSATSSQWPPCSP